MKKITKIMITLSSILAMAGASMFAVNHKMEQDNKDHIQDVYNQKQRSEDENIEIVADRYAQKEEYKRNEILNNKSFDASLLGSNFEFLKNREGYINTESYRFYSNYNNIKTNKNLTVYIDSTVPASERKLISENVAYLNTIFHTINPELSIKVTSQKQNSNSCICIYDSQETPRGSYGGTTLAETRSYEQGSAEYNGPINIYVYVNQISKLYGYNENVYKQYYKSVLLHEIGHALGVDHTNRAVELNSQNADELNKPLMNSGIASSSPKDFFSSPEIAEFFAWINAEKYAQAASSGTLESELSSDFQKYLGLINYSLNQSTIYNTYSIAPSSMKDNQIFEITYSDKIFDANENKSKNATVKLTFNAPCQNMYQKECTFEDGTITSFVAPYFYSKDASGNGKYSLLSSDLKKFETSNIYNSSTQSYRYQDKLTYSELVKLMENFDARNGYTITPSSYVFTEFSVETQNLWEKMSGKSTNNTFYVKSSTYSVDYKYSWTIGNDYSYFSGEETTNYLTEKDITKDANSSSDQSLDEYQNLERE